MSDCLRLLSDVGVNIETVIDVGVQRQTRTLIEFYPDKFHALFEPASTYHKALEENYAEIKHTLFNVALCDADETAYILLQSMDQSGEITHAQVSRVPAAKSDVLNVVSEQSIRSARLDTIVGEQEFSTPLLLKVDVDGVELDVLKGARDTLQSTSVVIVEMTLERIGRNPMMDRTQYLLEQGFVLIDMVDLAYYDGVLYKVDMVFVHQSCLKDQPRLTPFEAQDFVLDRKKWDALETDFRAQQDLIITLRERVSRLSEANKRLRSENERFRNGS